MSSVELKPCPFCGGEAATVDFVLGNRTYWAIKCDGPCDPMHYEDASDGQGWPTVEDAAAAWNRRAEVKP